MKKTVALLFLLSLPGVVHADWTQDTMRWQHEQQQIQDRQQERVNSLFGKRRRPAADDDAERARALREKEEEIAELRRQLEQQRIEAENIEEQRRVFEEAAEAYRRQQENNGNGAGRYGNYPNLR